MKYNKHIKCIKRQLLRMLILSTYYQAKDTTSSLSLLIDSPRQDTLSQPRKQTQPRTRPRDSWTQLYACTGYPQISSQTEEACSRINTDQLYTIIQKSSHDILQHSIHKPTDKQSESTAISRNIYIYTLITFRTIEQTSCPLRNLPTTIGNPSRAR